MSATSTRCASAGRPEGPAGLSYALPYDDIIKVGAQGFGHRTVAASRRAFFPYDESTPVYTQDLDKAKALLAEAGVKNLKLKLTYAAENPQEKRFVPLIKDAFAKIGVNVECRASVRPAWRGPRPTRPMRRTCSWCSTGDLQ
jgi:peptide/nickel transport system substrate-binding protein